jgi:hypothetical protein
MFRCVSRFLVSVVALGLVWCSSAGSASAAPPEVGSTVPDIALKSLEGTMETLSQRDGPTVLVFFRGVW